MTCQSLRTSQWAHQHENPGALTPGLLFQSLGCTLTLGLWEDIRHKGCSQQVAFRVRLDDAVRLILPICVPANGWASPSGTEVDKDLSLSAFKKTIWNFTLTLFAKL